MSRICFVALYAYPLFNPAISHIFGGAEVRAWLFGVGLSKLPNMEVSFIVLNHGQPEVEKYDKLKVYRHSYYHANPPKAERLWWNVPPFALAFRIGSRLIKTWKRFATIRLYDDRYKIDPRVFEVYEKVDADIYCTFGVSNFAAELATFCKGRKKCLILFSSNDEDFSQDYFPDSQKRNAYGSIGSLCYQAIMKADLIVTQTKKQSELLEKRFGRNSVTVLSPIDLDPVGKVDSQISGEERFALWIGKSDRIKQPEILLHLAARFKEIPFVMVLNRSKNEIYTEVLLRRPKNLQIIEALDYKEAKKLFLQAFLLINTSIFEGFPNTFLLAGKYGVPILSLQVDPDGFIKIYGCGIVADGNLTRLAEGLKQIYFNSNLWQSYSENIKRYIKSHHELNSKVDELYQIIKEFIERGVSIQS